MIILISVLALIVDIFTAKISHHGAHHNTNMKMVFIHNLADVFGSIGVIVSGLCIVWFEIYTIDGIIKFGNNGNGKLVPLKSSEKLYITVTIPLSSYVINFAPETASAIILSS